MFSPSLLAGVGSSDILGGFDSNASFSDINSGFTYEISSLRIAGDLSSADYGFDQVFSTLPGESFAQFELLNTISTTSNISPLALVEGTHSVSSILFGTVSVNVVPEPSTWALASLATSLLISRRKRN